MFIFQSIWKVNDDIFLDFFDWFRILLKLCQIIFLVRQVFYLFVSFNVSVFGLHRKIWPSYPEKKRKRLISGSLKHFELANIL